VYIIRVCSSIDEVRVAKTRAEAIILKSEIGKTITEVTIQHVRFCLLQHPKSCEDPCHSILTSVLKECMLRLWYLSCTCNNSYYNYSNKERWEARYVIRSWVASVTTCLLSFKTTLVYPIMNIFILLPQRADTWILDINHEYLPMCFGCIMLYSSLVPRPSVPCILRVWERD